MAEESRKQLLSSVKGLLSAGNYSDLKITCGSDSYNVHKTIACPRADIFARALRFSAGKEAEDSKIDLPEDEPTIVKLLIEYIYNAEYASILPSNGSAKQISTSTHTKRLGMQASQYNFLIRAPLGITTVTHPRSALITAATNCVPPPINGSPDQLLVHAKMYELSDSYDVVGLKDLARVKFILACERFWNVDTFPVAAHHAFSTTVEEDKGLRDVLCKTITFHMELLKKPEIKSLMTSFNGLAFGPFKLKAEQNS